MRRSLRAHFLLWAYSFFAILNIMLYHNIIFKILTVLLKSNSMLECYKSKSVLMLSLYVIGQIFVTAHAAEHGSEHHRHNCVICLSVLNDEQADPPILSQLVSLTFVMVQAESLPLASQILSTKNQALIPASTGPPSI